MPSTPDRRVRALLGKSGPWTLGKGSSCARFLQGVMSLGHWPHPALGGAPRPPRLPIPSCHIQPGRAAAHDAAPRPPSPLQYFTRLPPPSALHHHHHPSLLQPHHTPARSSLPVARCSTAHPSHQDIHRERGLARSSADPDVSQPAPRAPIARLFLPSSLHIYTSSPLSSSSASARHPSRRQHSPLVSPQRIC